MIRRVFAFLAVALLTAAPASAAPFFNGSFEVATVNPGSGFITLGVGNPSITGWEIFQSNIDYIGTFWEADDGNRSIDLNGNAGPGGIRQTFDTTAGSHYHVDFALAGNPDGGPTIKTVSVQSGAFTQVYTFSIAGATRADMNWTDYSFGFVAGGGTSTLSFLSQTPGAFYGPALDNVRVTVPEPVTLSLFALGLAGFAVRRRVRRG